MKMSEKIDELAKALSVAQGQMKGALKDSSNPFYKSKYADLSAVWEACREPLSKNGLAVVQTTTPNENGIYIETTLMHSTGQWISGEIFMKPVKDDPQGVGSTITYARRYALAAMVGVAPEDDDANAASGKDVPMTPKVTLTNEQKNQVHDDSIRYLEQGDEHGLRETWHGWSADEKAVLWSMFNSQQRSAMKKLMEAK